MTQQAEKAEPGTVTRASAGGGGSRLPDMTYTEQEIELRAAVRSVLEEKAQAAAVLARTETPQTYDTELWRTLAAQVGCAGLLIPESYGGAGASFRETAVVAEEIGRSVAPVPFLGSAVLATVAALRTDDAELATKLAAGTTTAVLAVPFDSVPGARPAPLVRVGPAGAADGNGTYRLSGTISGVADALPADVLIVAADGVPFGLYVVAADAAGLTRAPVVSLDMTRQLCDITLTDVKARRLAGGHAAESALAGALRAGAAMLAAEQLGLAERALDITLAYVKQRYQFARPVGSFQALKHRFADWWVAVTQARAASRYAAACLASGDPDVDVAVALAKAVCSDVAVLAGQEMIQLHGGIGFTWEHPAHLYLKRAKSSALALGTADRHRASLADLVNIPPPPR
ncbi:MAG TPA: acyl-CoA dehydrogenase family protein [Streptosporangiaceae bacterium]|nr:acyl-CoA dehydrogenase family protein [Streptosporangiaceae bacterium]